MLSLGMQPLQTDAAKLPGHVLSLGEFSGKKVLTGETGLGASC